MSVWTDELLALERDVRALAERLHRLIEQSRGGEDQEAPLRPTEPADFWKPWAYGTVRGSVPNLRPTSGDSTRDVRQRLGQQEPGGRRSAYGSAYIGEGADRGETGRGYGWQVSARWSGFEPAADAGWEGWTAGSGESQARADEMPSVQGRQSEYTSYARTQ
ncbi:MAG: hypothetical protein K6T31_01735 [Alicyclobacillus sp.]|nr:hypothetical protein [Alicyclobacillus sp.]